MERQRWRMVIEGIVQGVGFRPFVYQCARRWNLGGWVLNDSKGVRLEVEGSTEDLRNFRQALRDELPPLASISRLETVTIPPAGEREFTIRMSRTRAERTAQIAPDAAVCPDCLRELFNPEDRRYRYPFINCTNCGPRWTIITGIPYDRPLTTMNFFPMCPECEDEYKDPSSRRFHAQPNACPECGPHLTLVGADGLPMEMENPLEEAARLLGEGRIVAIKGLGGYHLAADPLNDGAVRELRRRKARDEKPFALMSFDEGQILRYAEADEGELRLLSSVERPIVLLRQKPGHPLSPQVAPRNRYFGVMLPYTPLHYLLLRDQTPDFPALIMTSANLSDEPISFRDDEVLDRLAGIADAFLIHNRPIFIRTDDSIARFTGKRPLLLRRSRGYVPRALPLPEAKEPILALGAELKNTVCLTRGGQAYLSQHIGDLKSPEVHDSFLETIRHMKEILRVEPKILACDLHPDYLSTRHAEATPNARIIGVQHHHAHLASCLADNGTGEEVIGVIFDGMGYGLDGRIWGGEFLVGNAAGFRRAGHIAYVPMPGGDAATREPFRMALSWLWRTFGPDLPPLPLLRRIPAKDLRLLLQAMEKGINSPLTSGCGRLFDAVAALAGIRDRTTYEGQAALELEMAIDEGEEEGAYPFGLRTEGEMILLDPGPMVRTLVEDLLAGASSSRISARFHNGLSQGALEVCRRIREASRIPRAALSGGVFQNRYLTERLCRLLEEDGFTVLTHSLVPPNDGGLSLGQAAVARARLLQNSV